MNTLHWRRLKKDGYQYHVTKGEVLEIKPRSVIFRSAEGGVIIAYMTDVSRIDGSLDHLPIEQRKRFWQAMLRNERRD